MNLQSIEIYSYPFNVELTCSVVRPKVGLACRLPCKRHDKKQSRVDRLVNLTLYSDFLFNFAFSEIKDGCQEFGSKDDCKESKTEFQISFNFEVNFDYDATA
jgi:hypothetical protein